MADPLDLDAFEADAVAGEYAPLEFRRDGKVYGLPHPSMLDVDELFKLDELALAADSSMASFQQLREFIATHAGEGGDAVRAMKPLILWKLIDAWQARLGDWAEAAEGDDAGGKEPSRSSGTNRATRRSKRTSPSGASASGKPRSAKSTAASGSSSGTRKAS